MAVLRFLQIPRPDTMSSEYLPTYLVGILLL